MFEHWLSFFFFAASVQGFFLAAVLGLQKRNLLANHLLALWVALLSLGLLGRIYYSESFYEVIPHLVGLSDMLPLSYGGLLYLYVRSLTNQAPLRWRDLIHFSGVIICLAINTPLLVLPADEKVLLVQDVLDNRAPWSIQLLQWAIPVYAMGYAIYSMVLLRRSYKQIDFLGGRIYWLKTMLALNVLIWCIASFSIWLPAGLESGGDQLINILIVGFIYALGYFSLRQPDVTAPSKSLTPKYGDNRLPDYLRAKIVETLETYMDRYEPWRDAELTVAQLAERTGILAHHLSQVLNDHLGQSFADYLNQFRVNAICSLLAQQSDLSLLDMAMQVGFSSKSTFNAIFKKHTGKTPSEYRKQSKMANNTSSLTK